MPINNFSLSENLVFHNTKIKVYPDGSSNLTYCKQAIFKDSGVEARPDPKEPTVAEVRTEVPDTDEMTRSREEQKKKRTVRDRTDEMIRLHRDRVRDIVLMNDFTHFLTITINPDEFDSFDVDVVRKKLSKWLHHQVERKGLKYILIPEYHESKRIHAHALVNDVFTLVPSVRKNGTVRKTKNGAIVYNVTDWRYGWSTCIKLDDQKMRVANYVTKYITKGSDKIFGKYFWSSKNIQREPQIILTDTEFESVTAEVFQPLAYNDNLQFKYESNFLYLRDESKCPLYADCMKKYPGRQFPPCSSCSWNIEQALDDSVALATEMEEMT